MPYEKALKKHPGKNTKLRFRSNFTPSAMVEDLDKKARAHVNEARKKSVLEQRNIIEENMEAEYTLPEISSPKNLKISRAIKH
jgi:hypothetical protein